LSFSLELVYGLAGSNCQVANVPRNYIWCFHFGLNGYKRFFYTFVVKYFGLLFFFLVKAISPSTISISVCTQSALENDKNTHPK